VGCCGTREKERKSDLLRLQLPQGELPFDASPAAGLTLLEFLGYQRKIDEAANGPRRC